MLAIYFIAPIYWLPSVLGLSLRDYSGQSCGNIKLPEIPNVQIVSIEGKERRNFTVPATPPLLNNDIANLNVCEVIVTLMHIGMGDTVHVQVWLPLANWNGRFVALGGTGWAAGLGDLDLAPLVLDGFAAASTDAGLPVNPFTPGSWALKDNGEVDMTLLTNFASRSIHDMAVIGKGVVSAFFGQRANYSYWKGCSTGGRQGLVAAQKYPDDFNGILAGAPAIYWPNYVVAEQWPQVVMKEENTFPSNCELNAITNAAIAACDELDGVKDGVITNPYGCKFDPFTTVGTKVQCGEEESIITRAVATVIRRIWDGPKTLSGTPLWYGLTIGAPLGDLANTTLINGTRTGNPFFVNDAWIKYFLKRDPDFDISSIDSNALTELFLESVSKYARIIGSADPDLSGFRNAGGKLIVWHGEADQLIFPQGTRHYRHLVEAGMRGSSEVDAFFRLFLAPGVDHCGVGTTSGAVPSNAFEALISWTENGFPPDVLNAESGINISPKITRKVCRYPLVSKYIGHGDSTLAENYQCVSIN